jgi:hypothetical protein
MRAFLLCGPVLFLGGCLHAVAPLGPEKQAKSAAGWQMPWEIGRVGYTALNTEEITTAWVPGTGMVRGTHAAISRIGQPMQGVEGPNRTAAACVENVESAAKSAGANSIEWVQDTPERPAKGGVYMSNVRFRITYPTNGGGYDLREQPLVCVTKPDGSIVDAYMAAP